MNISVKSCEIFNFKKLIAILIILIFTITIFTVTCGTVNSDDFTIANDISSNDYINKFIKIPTLYSKALFFTGFIDKNKMEFNDKVLLFSNFYSYLGILFYNKNTKNLSSKFNDIPVQIYDHLL